MSVLRPQNQTPEPYICSHALLRYLTTILWESDALSQPKQVHLFSTQLHDTYYMSGTLPSNLY
jgi:hypothetical protein